MVSGRQRPSETSRTLQLFTRLFSLFDIIQDRLQIERQRRVEFDAPTVGRVGKRQARGMEEGAFEALHGAQM